MVGPGSTNVSMSLDYKEKTAKSLCLGPEGKSGLFQPGESVGAKRSNDKKTKIK